MRFLSLCSGIEAASCAWEPLGWGAHAFAEIEAFPSAVLKHHYPDTPNWGDITKFAEWPDADVDVLVGGTPCQSFSVAGLRKGMADPRGNLALTFLAIAAKYAPRWICWENVPGVLSSEQGRDFGAFLGGLGECGYGWAYRVLDAQYFGVPQRRRRVFVVGHLGDWRRAAAVLFERHSLSGNPPPRREKGQGIANAITERPDRGGGNSEGQRLIPQGYGGDTAPTLNAAFGSKLGLDNQHIDSGAGLFIAHSLRAEGFDASEDGTGRGTPLVPVAFNTRQDPFHGPAAMPIGAKDNGNGLLQDSAVRRLTPLECERLQGFPDDYTAVPYRGKPAADGPRYKALGNSMAVPVMRWIGERIEMVEALRHTLEHATVATSDGDAQPQSGVNRHG